MIAIIKFLLFIVALLAVGITLTLSLPEYKVTSATPKQPTNYTVIADTLTTPLNMDDFLLATPLVPDTQYALRLGLYSQLTLAKGFAQDLQTTDPLIIVKAVDSNREWYLVIIGSYSSMEEAQQNKQRLQSEQISATLITWVEAKSD